MIERSHVWAYILGAVCVLALTPQSARAFCGFYVTGADSTLYANATMVVLMRDGTRTVLSMQNNYEGPPQDFALVIPVPSVLKQDQVKTLPREVFERVDALGAPRLVEYWEQDPCRAGVDEQDGGGAAGGPASAGSSKGVTVEASFAVGEYDIVILSADDSSSLESWLHDNNYNIPNGSQQVLEPYVAQGTKFFVAKVDPARVTFEDGQAALSPLRFHYDSADFTLPIRLGLLNSHGQQDLIVNILAPDRYEASNHPNAFIATNIRVHDDVRKNFAGFYEALFARVIDKHPGAVVTEYAWVWNNCDPCPTGEMLSPMDLATLGADVTHGGLGFSSVGVKVSGGAGGAGGKGSGGAGGGVSAAPPAGVASIAYTLTRLHYRYTSESLGEDLVFQKADPVEGGRGIPDSSGALSMEVTPSSSNNFQGRYFILHPWSQSLGCDDPQRGTWGGPPDDQSSATQVAKNSALVGAPPKAGVLTALVAQSLTSLDVVAENPAPPIGTQGTQTGCECGLSRPARRSSLGFGLAALSGGLLLVIWRRARRRHD